MSRDNHEPSRGSKLGEWDIPELPRIPEHPDVPTDPFQMGMPEGCAEIADFARTGALELLAKDTNIRGVGLGLRHVRGKETGEFAVQFLVHKKLKPEQVPEGCLLPKQVDWKGKKLWVDVLEMPGDIDTAQAPRGAFTRQTDALSGSAISNDASGEGGTLGGTFNALFGSGQRGLTCAHVAIGMGIQAFIANFPSSIGNLFRSPSGQEMIVSDGAQIGQNVYRLMGIDTPWPMLVPWPGPIMAGALSFIYVDGAAGKVRPRSISNPIFFPPPAPPPPPEKKRTVAGARIGAARAPLPGTPVYKIGQRTGITWGRILVSFLQIPIAVGPLVIIFDQILCRLTIGTGDSGSSLLMENGHHYLGSCWGSLGGNLSTGLGDHTLATPWWWLSLLLDINFL